MKSNLLENKGLNNYITGAELNFEKERNSDNFNQCIKYITSKLGVEPISTYTANQIHGDNIEYADGENGEIFHTCKYFKKTDGIITDIKGIAITITFADCTPIILFDPINKVQCSIHSGWKSTVKRILENGIDKMVNNFNCKKENIIAYLGPSIDINNYEVGKEVYDAFKDFKDRDKFFKSKDNGKFLLSVIDANYYLLIENGILKDNIEICRESTFLNSSLHSARRDGKNYQLNTITTIIK